MAGKCIVDDEVCREASVRKSSGAITTHMADLASGADKEEETYKLELIMRQAHITSRDRSVIAPALERAQETGAPAAAIELPDGSIITGKTSELLGALLRHAAECPEGTGGNSP